MKKLKIFGLFIGALALMATMAYAIGFPVNFQSNVVPPGLMQGIFSTSSPSLSDGQTCPLLLTVDGRPVMTTEPLLGANGQAAYRVANTHLTAYSTANDLFYIQGSAARTVRIKRILVTIDGATAGVYSLQLQRHGAIGTGTKAADTPQPYDSRNTTAASCAVYHYTQASGAPAGAVVLGSQQFYLVASAGNVATVNWDLATANKPPLILSGTGDFIGVSLNGATLTSNGAYDYEVELVEDGS